MLVGDVNARHELWEDKISNMRGKYLKWWYTKNNFKYKANLIGPSEPTYPSTSSYIDLGLFDVRVEIPDLINNTLPVIPYDSDQNALKFRIQVQQDDEFLYDKTKNNNFININKT